MQADFIIRQARVVDALQDRVADLAITQGQISAIAPRLNENAPLELDASGLVLLAGGIDPHVHFNEPGRADWEGLATGSRALAKGGMTSFFDMPLNSSPPTITAEDFAVKRRLADEKSVVNAYLWGGLTPHNLEHLAVLASCGVIGFKAFMSNSGIDDFRSIDDAILYEGMQISAELGKIVALHAENDSLTSALAMKAQKAGRTGIRDYLASRPTIAEIETIQRSILFAEATGCALHIVHVSTGRGVEMVLDAQARGVDVTCETCPHYLVFTEEDVERIGALAKCAPPIRNQAEQDALWDLLLAGQIPIVASDHSPAPLSLKQSSNFFEVWGGIASCQSTLQLMLTYGYEQRGMSLSQLANVTSYQTAQRFGLSQKGLLAEGMDADFCLLDLSSRAILQTEDLEYQHKISPYVDLELVGKVLKTWVKGKLVYG